MKSWRQKIRIRTHDRPQNILKQSTAELDILEPEVKFFFYVTELTMVIVLQGKLETFSQKGKKYFQTFSSYLTWESSTIHEQLFATGGVVFPI